eukprot:TRINITY_DN22584_c0_g1_i1.p1 TRINITY_DN22584_c0_g1~~TRINITY_DN22584_c0_g1_i1.p1  ORF type:complete len:627 (-),score=133.78 TRINITY_DN22584_c0_g1_i1:225-2105(-)
MVVKGKKDVEDIDPQQLQETLARRKLHFVVGVLRGSPGVMGRLHLRTASSSSDVIEAFAKEPSPLVFLMSYGGISSKTADSVVRCLPGALFASRQLGYEDTAEEEADELPESWKKKTYFTCMIFVSACLVSLPLLLFWLWDASWALRVGRTEGRCAIMARTEKTSCNDCAFKVAVVDSSGVPMYVSEKWSPTRIHSGLRDFSSHWEGGGMRCCNVKSRYDCCGFYDDVLGAFCDRLGPSVADEEGEPCLSDYWGCSFVLKGPDDLSKTATVGSKGLLQNAHDIQPRDVLDPLILILGLTFAAIAAVTIALARVARRAAAFLKESQRSRRRKEAQDHMHDDVESLGGEVQSNRWKFEAPPVLQRLYLRWTKPVAEQQEVDDDDDRSSQMSNSSSRRIALAAAAAAAHVELDAGPGADAVMPFESVEEEEGPSGFGRGRSSSNASAEAVAKVLSNRSSVRSSSLRSSSLRSKALRAAAASQGGEAALMTVHDLEGVADATIVGGHQEEGPPRPMTSMIKECASMPTDHLVRPIITPLRQHRRQAWSAASRASRSRTPGKVTLPPIDESPADSRAPSPRKGGRGNGAGGFRPVTVGWAPAPEGCSMRPEGAPRFGRITPLQSGKLGPFL